jgi:hypothetical protein
LFFFSSPLFHPISKGIRGFYSTRIVLAGRTFDINPVGTNNANKQAAIVPMLTNKYVQPFKSTGTADIE